MTLLFLALAMNPVAVVTCAVTGDSQARVYELRRSDEGDRARWVMLMRSREAGGSPVVLPLPDAKPVVGDRGVTLDYRTLNGGRNVKWTVDAAGPASLDVYTNFELEVNVEADLDPRVELMNTEGTLSNLSCTIAPKP